MQPWMRTSRYDWLVPDARPADTDAPTPACGQEPCCCRFTERELSVTVASVMPLTEMPSVAFSGSPPLPLPVIAMLCRIWGGCRAIDGTEVDGTLLRDGFHGHPFTAPERPLTKYRCSERNAIITGMTTMSAPAISWLYWSTVLEAS